MATKVEEVSFDRPIVESDGSLTLQSRASFRQVFDRLLIIGKGSPDGVVPAGQGASYMDEDGALGNAFYIKQKDADVSGDATKEWKLIG